MYLVTSESVAIAHPLCRVLLGVNVAVLTTDSVVVLLVVVEVARVCSGFESTRPKYNIRKTQLLRTIQKSTSI